eukprot:SAG31_NODE_1304_length_8894_cov_22.532689_6_plen_547_part_00
MKAAATAMTHPSVSCLVQAQEAAAEAKPKAAEGGEALQQLENEYAEFKAKAKAAVKQQKSTLKEQASAVEALKSELAASKRLAQEGQAANKTLAALREEYTMVDQQREEHARRASEAEQQRAAAVSEVGKLQQQAESWQQQRVRAQAKYSALKDKCRQQREEMLALKQATPAVEVTAVAASAQDLQLSAPSAPPLDREGVASSTALTAAQPIALAVEEEDAGNLFGDDLQQEYLLAQGGVQEYIFILEQERRAEREEMDFQLLVYMERCAKLQQELDRLRPAQASPNRQLAPVDPVAGEVVSTASGTPGGLPIGTVVSASAPPTSVVGSNLADAASVAQLRDIMGCTEEDAATALELANGNQDRAVEMLLGGTDALRAAATAAGADRAAAVAVAGPPAYADVGAMNRAPTGEPQPQNSAPGEVVSASVVGSSKTPGGITVYQLHCVDSTGSHWVADRRYTEFEALRTKLISAAGNVVWNGSGDTVMEAIPFPQKWGANLWQTELETIRQRVAMLRTWVEEVMRQPVASSPVGSELLRSFLCELPSS